MRRLVAILAVVAGLVTGSANFQAAKAQDYPNRPILLIVPFPSGGGNDTLARIVATKLGAALGQPVVVDNRGGANGIIAMRAGARATPDGYTLVFANSSTTTINLALHANAGYEPLKEFVPIGMLASTSIGIIVHPSFPAKTIPELIALAKKEPGKINIGTSVPGSGSYLAAEMFRARASIDVSLVPYKGSAALTSDVLGGHVPVIFAVPQSSLGNIQAGQLRMLAMTATQRVPLLPDVPTVSETVPGFEAVLRYGLLAPAGTPRPIVDRLNAALRSVVSSDDVKDRISKEAGNSLVSSPEEYAAEIAREDAMWIPLIKSLNIKPE